MPVIDLRIKYGVATPQYDQLTVIAILGIGGRLIGVVTDGVADIKNISSDDIQKVPIFDSIFNADCITGRVSMDEYRLVLLDIDRIISAEDVTVVEASIAA